MVRVVPEGVDDGRARVLLHGAPGGRGRVGAGAVAEQVLAAAAVGVHAEQLAGGRQELEAPEVARHGADEALVVDPPEAQYLVAAGEAHDTLEFHVRKGQYGDDAFVVHDAQGREILAGGRDAGAQYVGGFREVFRSDASAGCQRDEYRQKAHAC